MADTVPPFLWSDPGSFDSPKEYTVPGSGEVQPYTATATFDGSAAAVAFRPAIRIKSASGNLLALVFPADTIAAGGSDEVTFVPPFGSAASSPAPAGTASPDFAVANNTALTIVQGSVTNTYPYTAFATGNPSLFTLDGMLGTVNASASGFYEVMAYVQVFSGNPAALHLSLDTPLPNPAPTNSRPDASWGIYGNVIGTATAVPGVNQWQLFWRTFYNIETAGCKFGFRVIAEAAGGDWTGALAQISVVRLLPSAIVNIEI